VLPHLAAQSSAPRPGLFIAPRPKLIEGTDVTKLREIAKGLNAHVKKRIDEFWEH
jgi:hypothetical protein